MSAPITATVVLLAAGLLAPTPAASSAGVTCNGETATIFGGPDTTVTGTEGRDVVITSGASSVSTLGGDDLVCVTNGYAMEAIAGSIVRQPIRTTVDTGTGNDVVSIATDADVAMLEVVLGGGSDRLEGAATSVAAGAMASGSHSDTEPDTILLGSSYGAEVVSGEPGVANGDVVHLSSVGTVTWNGPMAPGAELVGSPGIDTLATQTPAGEVSADMTASTLGPDLRWSGFEDLDLTVPTSTTSLDVRGTTGPDQVAVRSLTAATRLEVALGDGADVLRTTTSAAVGSTIDGGGGRDRLTAESTQGLVVDLAGHRAGDLAVDGIEDVTAIAPRATVRGDGRPNRVQVAACRIVVDGRGGADKLFTVYDYQQLVDATRCSSERVPRLTGGSGNDTLIARRTVRDVLVGGTGNDRLLGGPGADTLLGGAGRDRVVGGTGRDVCDGERATGCERQR